MPRPEGVDRVNRPKQAEPAELRRRLEAGEWLLPGEVGALFGKSRFTVDYWLTTGKIKYKRGPGRIRTCDPADVRRLLDESSEVHGNAAAE